MRRPRQHVMEDESARLLSELLPSEWVVRSLPKDYGVDFEIELVDQEIVSGNRIWLQLKAVEKSKFSTAQFVDPNGQAVEGEFLGFPLETRQLEYALRCGFPLLLFVADLAARDIFWVPLRDDIALRLAFGRPTWTQQGSATVRVPSWNSLRAERSADFPGLRWYAMEPARMYAFARLHYICSEFPYRGRLSGYRIGDGFIEDGDERELRASLISAIGFLEEAVRLDLLFGENGIEALRIFRVPERLQQGIDASRSALELLDSGDYTFQQMALLLADAHSAMSLLGSSVKPYEERKSAYVFTEFAVGLRHL